MSRFFRGDSDSESSDNSTDEEVDVRALGRDDAKFMMSSSSSEDEKRVVRSSKEKFHDELRDNVTTIKNHTKIGDWSSLGTDFDDLLKTLAKGKSVTSKQGIPRFFFKAVLDLQDSANALKKDKAALKKLSKPNSKGLNILVQKIKKKFTSVFVKELVAYQANPLGDDDDEKAKPKKKKRHVSVRDEDDDDDDDDEKDDEGDEGDEGDENEFDSDSEDWDSSGSDESDIDLGAELGAQFTRDFWVKKDVSDSTKEDKEAKRRAKQEKAAEKARIAAESKKVEAPKVEKTGPVKEVEYTADTVLKKLRELQGLRGKRGTDKQAMVNELLTLSAQAHKVNKAAVLHVKTFLVIAYFDVALNRGLFLPVDLWKKILAVLLDVVATLKSDPQVLLSEDEMVESTFEDELDADDAMSLDSVSKLMNQEEKTEEELEAEEAKRAEDEAAGKVTYIKGNLFSFVQRLDAEYRKSLQNTDSHSTKYVDRLKDQAQLLHLLDESRSYYQQIKKVQFETEVALMTLEQLYYSYDKTQDAMAPVAAEWAASKNGEPVNAAPNTERNQRFGGAADLLQADEGRVAQLAAFMYKNGTSRQRMRALLCHVYCLAVHNKYQQARDLMLMSHAQDTINEADIKTRILYNRVMAQLGLCAFRNGEIRHALYALGDLYGSNRIKELIAQGVQARSWHREKDPKKEKLEKLRQYPYHMHMNLDMLEAVHLIAAMFVEAPDLALTGSTKRRPVTKSFRRLYDYHCKQAFNGPPDNTRDLIMASIKALLKGDWRNCTKYLGKLRMWKLVPHAEYVMAQLTEKVKEEAVRMHLMRFASQYTSISLDNLTTMFALDTKTVHRIASKMMVNERLRGAWDQPTGCIVMHPAPEQTPLQQSAVTYAEKITAFMEQNERLVDHRAGWYKNDRKQGWGGNKDGGRRGGGRGNWQGKGRQNTSRPSFRG